MKNLFTTLLLLISYSAFAQTTMTLHTPNGSTDYLLSDIDSITYSGNGGQPVIYNLGDMGPAGGTIVYDKGSFSNGWRYLEASTSETNISNGQFGCYYSSPTGNGIGTGLENTNNMLAFSTCSTPGIAIKICDLYSTSNNGVTYNDWFLPSIDELTVAFGSGLYFAYASNYWSSSFLYSTNEAYVINGNTGVISKVHVSTTLEVKPFRRF